MTITIRNGIARTAHFPTFEVGLLSLSLEEGLIDLPPALRAVSFFKLPFVTLVGSCSLLASPGSSAAASEGSVLCDPHSSETCPSLVRQLLLWYGGMGMKGDPLLFPSKEPTPRAGVLQVVLPPTIVDDDDADSNASENLINPDAVTRPKVRLKQAMCFIVIDHVIVVHDLHSVSDQSVQYLCRQSNDFLRNIRARHNTKHLESLYRTDVVIKFLFYYGV